MKRIIIIWTFMVAGLGVAMAQMPSFESIYSEAKESFEQGDWCNAKFCLLWAALCPELTAQNWDEMLPMLIYADSASKADWAATAPVLQDDTLRQQPISNQVPTFPGGDSALSRFIVEHLLLPSPPDQYFNQVVFVQLVIEKDGRISDAKIAAKRGFTPQDDEACLQLVRKMPYWRPGSQMCVPTQCTCLLPVALNLDRYRDKY